MKKYIFIFLVLNSYFLFAQNSYSIKSEYCITNDNHNGMGLTFQKKHDTAFLFYMNIIDNGNYVNGYDPEDKNDYAGYFTSKKFKIGVVQFIIKSYRDSGDKYMLHLKFSDSGKKCVWEITDRVVAYLPKNATFEECSEKK